MTELTPTFNVKEFEYYGARNPYLTPEQLSDVVSTELRVNSQLDWVAQLLGWSGPNYWFNLVSSVSEKRNLLTGSFGVYDGFIFPEIREVRNWENTVIIKSDPRIQVGQTFYLGDNTYELLSLKEEGDEFILSFGTLPSQFFSDLASNEQLKVLSPRAIPSPFVRNSPGISADASFLCEVENTSLVMYPGYDEGLNIPYVYNTLTKGSRYFFNLPVTLSIGSLTLEPEYSFERGSWFITVPEKVEGDPGIEGVLSYGTAYLIVRLVSWYDPSDWIEDNKVQNFKGVWSNKGGKLPFHFVFDALNLHGFDDKKSLYLPEVLREVSFDSLLNFIYYQKAPTVPTEPSPEFGKVWWNSQNGSFSVFLGDSYNCGPWSEIQYPNPPQEPPTPDYVFPTVSSFTSYSNPIQEGSLVEIEDGSGLSPSVGVEGLVSTLSGPCRIQLFKKEGSSFWTVREITYSTETDFSLNALETPERVPVRIVDSTGLSEVGSTYTVENLKIVVSDPYTLLLMKEVPTGSWYIAPPSFMRYIGDTRLFQSSLDFSNPVSGEMTWDFSVSDPNNRSARIFYYNDWQQDPLTNEWYMVGDWVGVNDIAPTGPVPLVVNFGAILVYCNGDLMVDGSTYLSEDFQLTYTSNPVTGNFDFKYVPLNYGGMVNCPVVTISDSLTSAFKFDISDLVFSGLSYYMSPNVQDSETLLRVWKTDVLQVTDSISDLDSLRYSNPLVADNNFGPADDNWERYFLRLPPAYQRNGAEWQKVNLVCQDFGYWGSSVQPEKMLCPKPDMVPSVYEEVCLYGDPGKPYPYLYAEPYLYSEIAYSYDTSSGDFENSDVIPGYDAPYDEFSEAEIQTYDPLHNRRAILDVKEGTPTFGNWRGIYVESNSCEELSGFLVNDLLDESVTGLAAPVWDASIYKFPPICSTSSSLVQADTNHFKVGYAFFAADLSSAEEAVFEFSV